MVINEDEVICIKDAFPNAKNLLPDKVLQEGFETKYQHDVSTVSVRIVS